MIVAFGCNRKWYKYLVVEIYSLLRHNNSVSKIYVLCEDSSIDDVDYLSVVKKKYDVDIVVMNVVDSISKYFHNKYNSNTMYTDFAYAKLLISELLDEDKVLYLDSDIIIRNDISSLWKTDINNVYAAGILDNGGHLPGHREMLGIKGKYINTGVILLNCKRIRDDGLTEQFFNIINSRSLEYPDQDAFNMVCCDKMLYLPSMYNFAMNNKFPVTRFVFDQRYRYIIHYTGNKSDWVANKFFSEEWYYEYDSYNKEILNNNEKNLVVAFSSNRKLYKYLPININSLLKYNDRIKKIYLVLEDDDYSSIDYMDDVLNKYEVEVEVINFSKVQFNYLKKKSDNVDTIYSNFCFAKLLLSELTNEKRIIYLDMDTIVKGDISLLWDMEFDDNYALGVKDYGVLDENYHYGTLKTKCKYINTGVIVLNLDKIRSDNLVTKLFDLINSRKLVYPDQDAFNLICNSKIRYLPSMYNCAFGVSMEVFDMEKVLIFHYPGDKEYWVTNRGYSENYFDELNQFTHEFGIENFKLY